MKLFLIVHNPNAITIHLDLHSHCRIKILNYAIPILDNVISSREGEVNRLISESYFKLLDYENAEKAKRIIKLEEQLLKENRY